eukprot:44963-Eustigmatos_ZCMA.PRE.1
MLVLYVHLDARLAMVQSLQGKDITIYGNGTQTRSFQYVDDLVDGLIKVSTGDSDYSDARTKPRRCRLSELMSRSFIARDMDFAAAHEPRLRHAGD